MYPLRINLAHLSSYTFIYQLLSFLLNHCQILNLTLPPHNFYLSSPSLPPSFTTGGELSECCVLDGVMFNKDVTHSKMRRRIENPRILLLDCPLEYKKGESQTNVEIMKEEDFNALLRQEEEYVEQICAQIVAAKPDIVITEKGNTPTHSLTDSLTTFVDFIARICSCSALLPHPLNHSSHHRSRYPLPFLDL